MSTLLKLPADVGKEILSSWLGFEDWSNLDVSFCSTGSRQTFLDLLKQTKCFSCSNYTIGLCTWLFSRGIFLERIFLHPGLFVKGQLGCPFNFNSVKEITVEVEPSAEAFDVLRKCQCLEGIDCGTGQFVSNLDPIVLQQLKGVSFQYSKEFEETVAAIQQHCRSLTMLHTKAVPFEVVDAFVDQFAEIVKVNPHLESILIPADAKTFPLLSEHCKSLRLVMMGVMSLPTAEVGQFIGSASCLTSLTMEDNIYREVKFIRDKKNDLVHLTLCKGDEHIHSLLSSIAGLNVVTLAECDVSPVRGVISSLLSGSASSLLKVKIESCVGLTSDSLVQILDQCKLLECLEIGGVNWSAISLDTTPTSAVSNRTVNNLFLKGFNLKASTVLHLLQACPTTAYCYATITTADRSDAFPLLRYARDTVGLIVQIDFNQSRGMMAAMMNHSPNNEPATVVHDNQGFCGLNHAFYTSSL